MYKLVWRFLSIIALLSFSTAAFGLEIQFKKNAAVKGNIVTLGDVAAVLPAHAAATPVGVVLSRAPAPGAKLTLKAADIKKYLIKENPDLAGAEWSGSRKIEVKRTAVLIDEQRIKNILADFINDQQAFFPQAELRVKNVNMSRSFYLPEGDLDAEIIPSDPSVLKSRRFTLIFRINGRVEKNIAVRGAVEALAPVVVAARNMRRGEIVKARDIIIARVDLADFGNLFFSPENVVGKEVKRLIRRGRPFDHAVLEAPPVIRRGELVTIAARKGMLTITARGIARADGREGELIHVSNSNSKKEVICKVDAPGLVVVDF